jgi:hypothetical protein
MIFLTNRFVEIEIAIVFFLSAWNPAIVIANPDLSGCGNPSYMTMLRMDCRVAMLLSMNMNCFGNISRYRNRNCVFSPSVIRLRHCESRPVGMWQSIFIEHIVHCTYAVSTRIRAARNDGGFVFESSLPSPVTDSPTLFIVHVRYPAGYRQLAMTGICHRESPPVTRHFPYPECGIGTDLSGSQ